MAIPATGYDSATITNPGAALTDFTLMIDLSRMSAGWWSDAENTGATRGRAAKNDGTTELATDWIDYNHGAETGWLRVKWSGTLASSGTQIIRIFPPKAVNTAYIASDTYGSDNAYDANWAGYWPLGVDGTDRTSNGQDMTAFGTPTFGVAAQVGDGVELNGSNQYLERETVTLTLPLTYLVWSEADSSDGAGIGYADSGTGGDWLVLLQDSGGNSDAWARHNGGSAHAEIAGYTTNTWHHIAAVFGSTTSRFSYLDSVASSENTTSNAPDDLDRTSIGRISDSSPSTYFDGILNEAQIHTAARSGDWISEEYDQTNDNATFWGTWSFTSPGGANAPTADLQGPLWGPLGGPIMVWR